MREIEKKRIRGAVFCFSKKKDAKTFYRAKFSLRYLVNFHRYLKISIPEVIRDSYQQKNLSEKRLPHGLVPCALNLKMPLCELEMLLLVLRRNSPKHVYSAKIEPFRFNEDYEIHKNPLIIPVKQKKWMSHKLSAVRITSVKKSSKNLLC